MTDTTLKAAETMSDPADLINRAVEVLQAASIDLPAFSALDRLINHMRTLAATGPGAGGRTCSGSGPLVPGIFRLGQGNPNGSGARDHQARG